MNSNQKISADRVIDYLHSMDIDGEAMEYILNGAHMTEQMLRQLVMKAPNEVLDNIIAERNSLKATKQTAVERLKIEIDKREYFSIMAMQGMLANITQDYGIPNVNEKAMEAALKREKEFIEAVAEKSIKYADALIKKLNK